MSRFLLAPITLAIAMAVAEGPAASQTGAGPTPGYQGEKGRFAAALVQFMAASAGTYGDEGPQVRSSLDAMQSALDRWDAAVSGYEAALRARAAGVDAHVTLATVYLDRGRVADALPELAAAIEAEPARPELRFFQGLAYSLLGKSTDAVESLRRAVALDPGAPVPLYELALHLRMLGRGEEALETDRRFEAAQRTRLSVQGPITAEPFTQPALLRLGATTPVFLLARYAGGATLLQRGDYAGAIQELRRAAATDPLTATAATGGHQDARVAEASAALRRGALHAAIDLLTAAVDSTPADAEAQRRLGMAYWADERYDQSAAHLRKAVALSPRDERARLALGDVLVTAGHLDDAERVLRDTVDTLPSSGQGWYRLGRLYYTLERYPEAVAAFEHASALDALAGLDGLYQVIGLVQTLQQNPAEAIAAYRHQIRVNPNDPAAHRALGDTLRDLDRYDEALTEYLAALLVDPGDAAAYSAVATIHLQRQEYADAVVAARRALALDANDKEAQYSLATALVRLGRTEEGETALQAFRRMQEADLARNRRVYELSALRREASLSLKSGDVTGAIARLTEAVERAPDEAGLHVELGLALLEAGRPREAIARFDRALQLDPSVDVNRQMAEAYGALGQAEQRQRYLELYERQKAERLQRGSFR